MKKYSALLLITVFLFSCTKTEYQQTRDSIRRADSLFTKANDGVKTLDSISKILNDSSKLNSEIRKQTKSVEKIIRDNSGSIDSLKVVIRKSGDRIGKSAETVKTLDSVQKVLRETNDPFEVLSTISKTIDKVTKESDVVVNPQQENPAASESQSRTRNENTENRGGNQQTIPQQAPVITSAEPIVKSGLIELSVNDLQSAEAQLRNEISNAQGQVVSEKLGEQAGENRQVFVLEIPLQKFDGAANSISRNIGSIRTKAVEQSGTQYNANRMSSLEVVLIEKINETAAAPVINPTDSQFNSETKESSAETVGKIVLAALPFLPILLIVGLVWYFINRNQKRRRAQEEARLRQHEMRFEQQQRSNDYPPASQPNYNEYGNAPVNPRLPPKPEDHNEDPYAKYKPKP